MSDSHMVSIEQERNYAPHRNLMSIARNSERLCQPDRYGRTASAWPSHATIAMTFTAMAIEGLANSVGVAIDSSWIDKHERKPVVDKFKQLGRELGISIDWNKHPWSSLKELIDFRHAVVHPKPELVIPEPILAKAEDVPDFMDPPLSTVEKRMTPDNASLAIRTFDDVMEVLHAATPEEHRGAAFHDMTIGSKTLVI
jgi:hypothetical protein